MTTLVNAEDERHLRTQANTRPEPVGPDHDRAPSGAGPGNVTIEDVGEGVLRVTLPLGGQITAEDGTMVRDRFLTLTDRAGAAVLLQITGVESVSREAVRVFSEAATVTAFAVLGSTSVDRVIAHGRRGLPLPQCPSRYFSDEQEALAWLRARTATAGSAIS